MKIKAQVEVEISLEERKRIAIDYLKSLIPYESEIKTEGLKDYWFSKIYDGYGKSVIKYDKGREVTKEDKLIYKVISWLQERK